jgi:hypothetical protein
MAFDKDNTLWLSASSTTYHHDFFFSGLFAVSNNSVQVFDPWNTKEMSRVGAPKILVSANNTKVFNGSLTFNNKEWATISEPQNLTGNLTSLAEDSKGNVWSLWQQYDTSTYERGGSLWNHSANGQIRLY